MYVEQHGFAALALWALEKELGNPENQETKATYSSPIDSLRPVSAPTPPSPPSVSRDVLVAKALSVTLSTGLWGISTHTQYFE